MVSLSALWLPVLLSTAVLFVAASVIWMVLPFHKKDWAALPDEEGFMEAMRQAGLPPGTFTFPFAADDERGFRRYEE